MVGQIIQVDIFESEYRTIKTCQQMFRRIPMGLRNRRHNRDSNHTLRRRPHLQHKLVCHTSRYNRGFPEFRIPNGVAILPGDTDYAYVTNTNPISYFPTEFGHGWVTCIELHPDQNYEGEVVADINTQWLNPQNVIVHDNLVYVSCSGTIDWTPPDYIATAMDNGGVHVIDPDSNQVYKIKAL